jgi:hypothetical protein
MDLEAKGINPQYSANADNSPPTVHFALSELPIFAFSFAKLNG